MASDSIDDLNGDEFFYLPKYWVSNASDIKTLVYCFDKEGAFNDEKVVHSLNMRLTAISDFEKEGKDTKVIEHTNDFKSLIDHQKEKNFLSEKAHERLKDGAEQLIEWTEK